MSFFEFCSNFYISSQNLALYIFVIHYKLLFVIEFPLECITFTPPYLPACVKALYLDAGCTKRGYDVFVNTTARKKLKFEDFRLQLSACFEQRMVIREWFSGRCKFCNFRERSCSLFILLNTYSLTRRNDIA